MNVSKREWAAEEMAGSPALPSKGRIGLGVGRMSTNSTCIESWVDCVFRWYTMCGLKRTCFPCNNCNGQCIFALDPWFGAEFNPPNTGFIVCTASHTQPFIHIIIRPRMGHHLAYYYSWWQWSTSPDIIFIYLFWVGIQQVIFYMNWELLFSFLFWSNIY